MSWIFAVLMLAGFGQAQKPEDCSRTLAIEYERSGEAPRDVARAVAIACDTTDQDARPNNLLGQMAPAERERWRVQVRQLYEDTAMLLVIRLRACRKTPGCDLRSIR